LIIDDIDLGDAEVDIEEHLDVGACHTEIRLLLEAAWLSAFSNTEHVEIADRCRVPGVSVASEARLFVGLARAMRSSQLRGDGGDLCDMAFARTLTKTTSLETESS
jgi:hypothetical protein